VNRLLDRLRGIWDDLNDRERRLFGTLGAVLVAFVLGFPLFWTARENAEIEAENAHLRSVLELIAERHDELALLAQSRRNAAQRYLRRTPPLGSFLEEQASQQNLKIQEVTDQPEKSVGNYHRRRVTATIAEANLTGIVNLLGAIAASPFPVAVESIQIEHYQPGDTYRIKFGIVTYDRKQVKPDKADDKEARRAGSEPSEG